MTPCPDLDRLVDDALSGLPGAQERLAAHADACAACLAEADCAHAPVPEMALLAEAACPPDVLAAALAEAAREPARTPLAPRHAADRPAERAPERHPTPRPVWTRRIAAGLAVAAVLFALRGIWPSSQGTTAAPELSAVPPSPATVAPPADGPDLAATTVQPTVQPTLPTPQPAPRAATPVRRTPRAARPARTAPAVADTSTTTPLPVPAAVDPVETAPVDEFATVTPADSAAARQDLLLALAIVSRAGRTADAAVSVEMRRVSDALEPARTL